MTPSLPALLLGLCCSLAGTAQAQTPADANTAYRCGNGNYSSAPCPGGVKLGAADARSAAQQQQAREAADRDARLARQLTDERHARERAAVGQKAINVGPVAAAPPAAAASKGASKKPKKPKSPARPKTPHAGKAAAR